MAIEKLFSNNPFDQEPKNAEEENFRNSLFFGMCSYPETPRQRDGRMRRQYSDMGENYHRLTYEEDEEGHKIDMRLLMVLEYFRELYVRQVQVLKNMFLPGAKDEFLDFFKKIGEAMPSRVKPHNRPEFRTMQRSLSVGSRGVALEDPTRMERFKVTTVNAGGPTTRGGGGGAAGQGGTKK